MKKLLMSLLLITPFMLCAQGKMNATQVVLQSTDNAQPVAEAAATPSTDKTEAASADDVSKDCRCKGKVLKGKVKVVNAFPDFKVQVVDAFPDIKVKTVSAFPDDCGEWQFVDAFPDFTIQFVDAFPDFKIKFVDAFPGVD